MEGLPWTHIAILEAIQLFPMQKFCSRCHNSPCHLPIADAPLVMDRGTRPRESSAPSV